jgi:hypothetical protein
VGRECKPVLDTGREQCSHEVASANPANSVRVRAGSSWGYIDASQTVERRDSAKTSGTLEKKKRKSSVSWLGFCVRFFCGAFLGSLLGFGAWVSLNTDPTYQGSEGWWVVVSNAWFIIPACAIVLGLASAWWGDDFWDGPRDAVYGRR